LKQPPPADREYQTCRLKNQQNQKYLNLFRQLTDLEGKQVSATLADKQDDIPNWNVNNIFL